MRPKRIVVAGGAGFLGSHLCDALLARGDEVVCVDNYITGRAANVAHLASNASFALIEQDIVEAFDIDGEFDTAMNSVGLALPKD